ncbi:hypothetical protein [Paenibacillus campinasensis]|uniref:Spore coat protein n=1 Tax=Paenibacillus campinasensis TaxID=66347 RepID=A0A268ELV4_9BACL|nr:hypothetical protein [Paenibacillus campinasensis]PAD74091.1 hypothetical protein CHH67_18465 [Paenibacillus campinasensis]
MNMLKWLLKLCLSAILVSFLTIMTTGFVVNAYIQSLLASFNIQLEGQPFGLSTMMQSMLGDRGASEKKNAESPVQNAADSGRGDANDPSSHTAGQSTPEGDGNGGATGQLEEEESTATEGQGEVTDEDQPPDNSLPVMGGVDSRSEDSGLENEQLVMTPNDIVDKKDSLPVEDKEEIFLILMQRLPQAEMQKISEAMENGLTTAELEEIEQIVSKYLNEEEFDRLLTKLQE